MMDDCPKDLSEAIRDMREDVQSLLRLAVQMTGAAVVTILFPLVSQRVIEWSFGVPSSPFIEAMNKIMGLALVLSGLYATYLSCRYWRQWFVWHHRYQSLCGFRA